MSDTENTTQNNQTVEDSIIKEQSVTIKTLTEQLKTTGTEQPQIIYSQSEKENGGQPNFILIGVLGFLAWQFLRRA